jgi:hypothetical protein
MSALLSGDTSVEIVRFETEYQQRRVVCTDTDLLEHLKRALVRPAPRGAVAGGLSYVGYFKFRSGGTFRTYMQVGKTGFTVSMPAEAAEEAFPTHDIVLPQPSLDKVKELFDFLQESNQTAAGTVLVMETGKPSRRESEPSLRSP